MELEGFGLLFTPVGQKALGEAVELVRGGADPVVAASTLRRGYDAELVSAALTQAGLRRRAAVKFGADAEVMYFTPHGLEQATRREVADHRAARLVERWGPTSVGDACCGVGGDLIALARAGCGVDAVDIDPVTVAVARANVEALGLTASVRAADAASLDPAAYGVLFADPARRSSNRRTFDPRAYSPPWPVLMEMVGRARGACLKVAPGIPYEFIPDEAEAEWVSFRGEVKEASLWLGGEARRRATLLPGGDTLVAKGVQAEVGAVGRYLYEPDGAAVRAHLVGEVAELVGGWLIDPQIAYLTSDVAVGSPWVAGYEVEEVMPFSLKRLRAALRERRVGVATIKKRGSAVDVERLRKDLRLSGENTIVVILTRIGERPIAVLATEMAL
ncbi:class I SAM-dependent methyltransferase [Acrocarpospora macrocephala]|uniref:Methyltransferase n=1 Tax=Acrocarpospora macrocephala TaxID=150177 RepID=A0A5M3WX35_9ACTN|nr:class I SAM-dependent methyltransferase [Acrocarpospora macrocephala]GES14005.1 methyltransferase [Acrocarpospora macrocephala]